MTKITFTFFSTVAGSYFKGGTLKGTNPITGKTLVFGTATNRDTANALDTLGVVLTGIANLPVATFNVTLDALTGEVVSEAQAKILRELVS